MIKLKQKIKNAEFSLDWDWIAKDIEAATGEKTGLSGTATHYSFKSWDELEAVLLDIASEAWSNAVSRMCDEKKPGFTKWYNEFIKKIKP